MLKMNKHGPCHPGARHLAEQTHLTAEKGNVQCAGNKGFSMDLLGCEGNCD